MKQIYSLVLLKYSHDSIGGVSRLWMAPVTLTLLFDKAQIFVERSSSNLEPSTIEPLRQRFHSQH
ncbi:hypothetical protein [Thermocoleostomius sinensis]|uniref:Uncharacterized protein n=1 Tax=Thermocoleostomius sinensis A174 TaxID=2016057 RepID=A0A9E8ZFP7_9CYAN|nr:hypothetical protein [Thermocoleostomius sinensis]WAL61971.1 hypothetical protein OXH18_08290 [Thermocoleostomius sinensis A174]